MTHCSRSTSEGSRGRHPAASPAPTLVLVGNPNVGKSALFRNLTNRYVTVSNYPGTTVEIVRARAAFDGHAAEVIDTPGINDLSPRSEDGRVTLAHLESHPEATVIQVADARNLRRALLLTMRLAERGRPMVLVLNMQDELEERGGAIDCDRLSEILGVPVVMTVAPRNKGTRRLIESLPEARRPRSLLPAGTAPDDAYERTVARLEVVNRIVARTYRIGRPASRTFRSRLGFWAMQPARGLGLLALVLLGVFWFVGLFGAGTMVDLLEVGLFEQRLSPLAIRAADAALGFPHAHEVTEVSHTVGLPLTPIHETPIATLDATALSTSYSIPVDAELTPRQQILRFGHDLLVGEYGTITMALSYALAIVLPIVATFFLVFSLLEDSGYFPRMAILLNRTFRRMGLNGKAVLPIVLGLGCATMATMTTRILETRKERLVTTMLLALAIPCSAQLGVLLAMMAALSPAGAIAWLALVVGVLLAVGWLSARAFPGESSEFILEIPPIRRPQLSNVLVKTASRIEWYLREVIPIFVIGTAVLFLLDRLGLLSGIARAGEPLVAGWLGLPPEMASALLVGFLRRDFGAVYIFDAVTSQPPLLSPEQLLVAMVTITLFMPCFANLLMIAREHGAGVAWRMALFIFPFAFLVGGVVRLVSQWIPLS